MQVALRSESQGDSCPERLVLRLTARAANAQEMTHLRIAMRLRREGSLRLLAADSAPDAFEFYRLEESENHIRLVWESSRHTRLSPGDTVLLHQWTWETPTEGCLTFAAWEEARLTCADTAHDACLLYTHTPVSGACIQQRRVELAAYYAHDGSPLTGWEYRLTPCEGQNRPRCERRGESGERSTIHTCACPLPGEEQGVRLHKPDTLLRGVNTADIIALMRHILGIKPIEDGLRLLAADVGNDGIVSTSDARMLCEALLGRAYRWSRPWRFWPQPLAEAARATPTAWRMSQPEMWADCGEPAEEHSDSRAEIGRFRLPFASDSAARLAFAGFKVGDVNADLFHSPPTGTPLGWGTYARMGSAGQRVEIPVFALENTALAGWQLVLQYDTTLLQISGVRWAVRQEGANGDYRDWHSPTPGEIRLLCFSGNQPYALRPGQPIFFIEGTWKRDVRQPMGLISTPPKGEIASEAYDTLLTPRPCSIQQSDHPLFYPDPDPQPAVECRLSVEPNPNRGRFRLHIEASAPTRGYLRVSDAYQRSFYEAEIHLPVGLTAIPSARIGALPPGRYRVSLATPDAHYSLVFMRQ